MRDGLPFVTPALAVSLMVAPEVDIIEIGTSLCSAAGLDAIRSVREVLPNKGSGREEVGYGRGSR
jgi:3-keto-L-gulonate-6-phosphate decarboxylase